MSSVRMGGVCDGNLDMHVSCRQHRRLDVEERRGKVPRDAALDQTEWHLL